MDVALDYLSDFGLVRHPDDPEPVEKPLEFAPDVVLPRWVPITDPAKIAFIGESALKRMHTPRREPGPTDRPLQIARADTAISRPTSLRTPARKAEMIVLTLQIE